MNLYLISQTQNNGCDTYSDAVVVAPDEETARRVYPDAISGNEVKLFIDDPDDDKCSYMSNDWVTDPNQVAAELIGVADSRYTEITVICASFHAD